MRKIIKTLLGLCLLLTLTSCASQVNKIYYDFNTETNEYSVYSNSRGYTDETLFIKGNHNYKPVTAVNNYGFKGFYRIEHLVVEEGIIWIGEEAFFACEKLESVTLPSTLKVIGREAFKGCISLENVSMYSNIDSIDRNAFSECDNLKTIEFNGTMENAKKMLSGLVLKSVTIVCSDGEYTI